jgi:DNA-binding Xre family transcriptional regulator
MPMINIVKNLVDSKGITVYRFRKDTGISQTTAYELYNNPQHLPSIKVIERICEAYQVQPNEIIQSVSWKEYQCELSAEKVD